MFDVFKDLVHYRRNSVCRTIWLRLPGKQEGCESQKMCHPKQALAKGVFAENHVVMAKEAKAKVETVRPPEAEAAKECADTEEKAHKVQEDTHTKGKADADAKKAAAEANTAQARTEHEAVGLMPKLWLKPKPMPNRWLNQRKT